MVTAGMSKEEKMKLSRREFLKFGAAVAVLHGFAAPEEGIRPDIPNWARKEIDAAVNRFRCWKGDDEVVAFVFLTDIHSCIESMPQRPDFSDSRFHALFAQVAADQAGCDFIVDGGDHDYERGPQSTEALQNRMSVTEAVYSGCTSRPVLFCLGNHDHGAARKGAERPISSAMFGDRFNGLAVRHGHRIVFGENRSWGYYDVPDKKFRAIFVNTSDEGYYGFSTSQLEFIDKALASLPDGWVAALFGHYCVLNEIGHWKQYEETDFAKRKQEFIGILKAFVRRRPNDLAGYFCGDSHFDNEQELAGINWTISQGYGGIDRANLPWGARRTEFSRKENMLFELVAVKAAIGEFKVFRVGAGGAGRDRLCCFHNKF